MLPAACFSTMIEAYSPHFVATFLILSRSIVINTKLCYSFALAEPIEVA